MNKKNFKTIMICAIVLILVLIGAIFSTLNSHLGKFNDKDITIDITESIDINSYLSNVKKGTEVTYELDEDNSKLVVNLTKGKKVETFEAPVNITYPRIEVQEDVVVDTFVGYDINDFIKAEDGVTYSYDFDEDSGDLIVNYSKGNYTNTINANIKVISSDPKDNVRYYECTNIAGVKYQMRVYPDNRLKEVLLTSDTQYSGHYEMIDDNYGEMYDMGDWPPGWRMKMYISDDSSEASFYIGNDKNGGRSSRDYCQLFKVKSVY